MNCVAQSSASAIQRRGSGVGWLMSESPVASGPSTAEAHHERSGGRESTLQDVEAGPLEEGRMQPGVGDVLGAQVLLDLRSRPAGRRVAGCRLQPRVSGL